MSPIRFQRGSNCFFWSLALQHAIISKYQRQTLQQHRLRTADRTKTT